MTAILGTAAVYGRTAPIASVQLSSWSLSDDAIGPATVTYQINSNGTVVSSTSGILESWLLGGGTNSNYEVMATIVSGTLSSGTTGSWLNCSTTHSWAKSNSAQNNSVLTVVLTVQIRFASTGVVQDSATITLSAESETRS